MRESGPLAWVWFGRRLRLGRLRRRIGPPLQLVDRAILAPDVVADRAGLHGCAAAPEGEGHDETAVCGLDAGLVDLVGRTGAVVERDLFHGVLLSRFVVENKKAQPNGWAESLHKD